MRAAGERSIRITLKPVSVKEDFPVNPAIVDRKYPPPALSLREITGIQTDPEEDRRALDRGPLQSGARGMGARPQKKKAPLLGEGGSGGMGKR